ncbi:binding-protein-dependent transport systems inner membrane component [Xylanimonas cellulosilytica DSM 15894]|uniref:Binding-protein-dependent transport systems inner membrane component n=1 Tax=Xylanimonas cellulosilytica (strain DSM 15894 / JCM 12276 / CECT 5975 / KCTC 9989 / LMG 20990 / NBRC 107835 / XIL07) TaxID=446471 RepID=D1BYB7_XYLCX|nr:binding-protein-dependent transport systems inner membrane component [Xylanimonas cellulosilytica DSM 15894]
MTATVVSETPVAPVTPPRKKGLGSGFAMFRNGKSLTGLAILGVFVLMAVFAPLLTRFEPLEKDFTALRQPPSGTHWLGTTHMGEDVFAQIVYGTRGVLIVGFAAGIIATVIAIAIGVTAGYVSGWKSESLSALTNVFLVIPGLPLMIIITSQQENPSLFLVAAVLAITGWAWGGRVLRAQTMSLRNRDFVQAARANGEPLWRIITVEMLPNLMAIIASSFVGTVTAAVLGLTTLAFIGVIPITNLNWGTILFWAQQNGAFPDFWWWYVPAGLAIALLGVALSLINFGIDEYVNPRLRSAGERARALRKRGMKASSSVTEVRAVRRPPTTTPPIPPADDDAVAVTLTKDEA